MGAVNWSTVKVLLLNIKSVHRAGRESQLPATVPSLPSTTLTATSGVEPQTHPLPHTGGVGGGGYLSGVYCWYTPGRALSTAGMQFLRLRVLLQAVLDSLEPLRSPLLTFFSVVTEAGRLFFFLLLLDVKL